MIAERTRAGGVDRSGADRVAPAPESLPELKCAGMPARRMAAEVTARNVPTGVIDIIGRWRRSADNQRQRAIAWPSGDSGGSSISSIRVPFGSVRLA